MWVGKPKKERGEEREDKSQVQKRLLEGKGTTQFP